MVKLYRVVDFISKNVNVGDDDDDGDGIDKKITKEKFAFEMFFSYSLYPFF